MSKHDIPGVVKDFQMKRFPERAELMKHVMTMMEEPEVKLLMAEIGAHCAELNSTPVQVLGIGFTYGAVIGILAEKYRRRIVTQ